MGCQAKGQTHPRTRLAQTHTWLRTTLLLGDTLNVPKRPVPACWHLPGAVTRLSTGEATLWEKAQAAAASEAAMRVLRILKLCFANEGKQPCLYRASSSRQRVGKSRSATDVRVFLQVPAETSQLLMLGSVRAADLADFPPLLLRDIRRPAGHPPTCSLYSVDFVDLSQGSRLAALELHQRHSAPTNHARSALERLGHLHNSIFYLSWYLKRC